MVDYPHASAACLCYLDEREGGEEGESKDAGCLMFSLFFCCPAGLSTLSCWPFEIGKRKKENEESRKERASGSKSAVDELDFSLTHQSAVWSKLLWTTSFRVEGLSLRGWQLHGDKVQLALVGVEGWGGPRSKWDYCNGFVPWKIAFCPRPFQANSWLQSG